jgi:hypothetical protein
MYSVWCDGTLENEEVRRDLIARDPEQGIVSLASHPFLGVVGGWAMSISANEQKRCRVRREDNFMTVGIYENGEVVEVEGVSIA